MCFGDGDDQGVVGEGVEHWPGELGPLVAAWLAGHILGDCAVDPVATLKAFDDAMVAGDRGDVAEAADAMVGWLEKGGFMPVGPHGADWRGSLSSNQLASYFRTARAVAEMV